MIARNSTDSKICATSLGWRRLTINETFLKRTPARLAGTENRVSLIINDLSDF
jgi:hypothetical protein